MIIIIIWKWANAVINLALWILVVVSWSPKASFQLAVRGYVRLFTRSFIYIYILNIHKANNSCSKQNTKLIWNVSVEWRLIISSSLGDSWYFGSENQNYSSEIVNFFFNYFWNNRGEFLLDVWNWLFHRFWRIDIIDCYYIINSMEWKKKTWNNSSTEFRNMPAAIE